MQNMTVDNFKPKQKASGGRGQQQRSEIGSATSTGRISASDLLALRRHRGNGIAETSKWRSHCTLGLGKRGGGRNKRAAYRQPHTTNRSAISHPLPAFGGEGPRESRSGKGGQPTRQKKGGKSGNGGEFPPSIECVRNVHLTNQQHRKDAPGRQTALGGKVANSWRNKFLGRGKLSRIAVVKKKFSPFRSVEQTGCTHP